MSQILPSTSDYAHIFLEDRPLLDLRAPIEFAEGAFPHTTNLPLLTDEERHRVGIAYKESGQDAAIALGYTLVDGVEKKRRIALWSQFIEQHPNAYLYCFRGGLRSRLTQAMLAEEAGIEIPRIEGGYKKMRRFLIDQMDINAAQARPIVLGGRTGVGKTDFLHQFGRTIDLEGAAKHKGSAFGREVTPQPTQINIENQLSIQLMRLMNQQPSGPILIEDEGTKIGARSVPKPLWHSMQRAPLIVLEASMDDRIEQSINDYIFNLLNDYRRTLNDESAAQEALKTHIFDGLNRVQKRMGGVRHKQFMALAELALHRYLNEQDQEALRQLIANLLTDYYDPMYDYQLDQKQDRIVFSGTRREIHDWLVHEGLV